MKRPTRRGVNSTRVALACAALAALALLTSIASALAASPSAAPSSSAHKVVLRLGWTSEPDSLNPFVGYQSSCYEVWTLSYDRLTGYDANLQPAPELAESWTHSPDGKVWTFKIRKGVLWQDGVPLTARDVAFTYNYVIQNDMTAFTSYTDGIDKAVATDDTTVQLICAAPKANILGMTVPILPEHIWGKVSPKLAASTYPNAAPFVGSGPFQVVEWKKNGYVRLVANPTFWGGRPHIDEVIFVTYQNPDTMALDLKAGRLDGAWGVPPAQYRPLKTTPGLAATSYFTVGFDQLTFNTDTQKGALGNPVVRDPAFRYALGWAIDKQKIVDIAYGGRVRVADSLIPSGMYDPSNDYHWVPPASEAQTFDLAKAAQALDAAGYHLVKGVRLDKQGKPITLRLYARSESLESQTSGKFIAGWFDQLGIIVNLQIISEAALSDRIWNMVGGKMRPDYDMFLWGWVGDVDPNFLLSISTKGQIGGWNQSNWSDPEYDHLFVQQQQQLDQKKRKLLVWRMEQILFEKGPFIPLIYMQDVEAWNTTRWQGWTPWPAHHGGVFYTYTRGSYLNLRPAAASAGGSSGSGGGWIVGVVIAAVAVVAAAAWLLVKRRQHAEEH